jgi:hypothetical protein
MDLPALENLLKRKRSLRELWQVTWYQACKTAGDWVPKTSRWMTHRKELEQWERKKIANCEFTLKLWPIAKSLMKRDGPKAPITIHGPLGITYCGVFTPYKNYNVETRSRDYAIVDEMVYSPCCAEDSRPELRRAEALTSRYLHGITPPRVARQPL